MAGARELIFDIFAVDRASATLSHIGLAAEGAGTKTESMGKRISGGLTAAGIVIGAVGVASVKTAASMETAMTKLTSTAGESAKNISMVQAGIDDMAGRVGFTVTELADAMYYVESGGYHGAKGLEVLDAAAKAARIEGANATDVAHALTGALNDYRGTNLTAAQAANTMTTAVGHGMMTFQDFAEALPKIGSRAASAHITFTELTAAMSTMTQDGLPASVAATYLGQTIGQLAAPTNKAWTEMKKLGINATDVAAAITSGSGHGLGDALKMLYDGITKHLTPSGMVAVETFKKSKGAMSDFQKMVANVPPDLQTTVQALALASGGVKAFQGVLMLGGRNAGAYNDNLKAMNDTVKKGGKEIAGFGEQQATLNGKLHDVDGAFSAFKDRLGRDLLPVVSNLLDKGTALLGWLEQNRTLVETVGGAVLTLAAGIKIWTAAQWLLNFAMDANPIGLVVLAIAALVAGIVIAYQNSETFRNIVSTAFTVVKTAAMYLALGAVMYFHMLANVWMTVAGTILDGAAYAFQWVPGLGPKLQGAAASFHRFKDAANAELDKIQRDINLQINTGNANAQMTAFYRQWSGKTIEIQANMHADVGNLRTQPGHASGGFVRAGVPVTVGENHPETFIPAVDGTINPHRPSVDTGGSQRNAPLVNIENYHEGTQSPDQIAASLMFRARFA